MPWAGHGVWRSLVARPLWERKAAGSSPVTPTVELPLVTALLDKSPVLLLFVVLSVGTALGAIRIRGISVGPAAVLFSALAVSALDARLALPEVLGTFGLALFAYTVGLTAGPSFFSSLRRGARPVIVVFGVLAGLGVLTAILGRILGLDKGTVAGLYAGANTNTPGLAAAIERLGGAPEPTVAYSLTYTGGVLVLLAAAAYGIRHGGQEVAEDLPGSEAIINATIKVTRDNVLSVRELTVTPHGRVLFSRHQVADGSVDMSRSETVLRPGDRVLAIGPRAAVEHITKQLGRRSKVNLDEDRQDVDFRRIVLSEKQFYGRTVAELKLWTRFGARATRVRRADHDFLATDGFILQAGDRIRVAAPREKMSAVARYLGDSEHGTSDINPLGLALGLAIGLLFGALPILIPGLGTLVLGNAAGPLIIGLLLGRMQRSGRVVWTLPHQGAEVLTQLGLLLFLAYAGGRAGSAFIDALRTPLGWKLIVAGLLVSAMHGIALVVLASRVLRANGPRTAGFIAGSQTQPAVLAFANAATRFNPEVALGYALVYPVAMVTKILVAQILTFL